MGGIFSKDTKDIKPKDESEKFEKKQFKEQFKDNKKEPWFWDKFLTTRFMVILLTISTSIYFLLNTYRFRSGTSGGLKIFGILFLVITWILFIGLFFTLTRDIYEENKNKTNSFVSWFVFQIVITIVIFIFCFFFIPYYLANAGVFWKGSQRTWNPFDDDQKGNSLINILNGNQSDFDEDGLYWGKKTFFSKIWKFLLSIPLIITNFFTGFSLFTGLQYAFGLEKWLPNIVTFFLSFLSFPTFIIPAFYGDGSPTGDQWLMADSKMKIGGDSSQWSILYYILLIPKFIFSIINFGGWLGKAFNPIDWKLLGTIVGNNYGKGSLAYMYNTSAFRKENIKWSGIFTFWLYYMFLTTVFKFIATPITLPLNTLNSSTKNAYTLLLIILIILTILSYITKDSTQSCKETNSVSFFNSPCSNPFSSIDEVKRNLDYYAKNKFSPGSLFVPIEKKGGSSESENKSQKSEAESPQPESENKSQKSEAESPQPESENKSQKSENKSPESENKSQKSEAESPQPESENKSQKSENKSQKSENKSPESENKSPESENKSQKSENKSPESENKSPESENKSPEPESGNKTQKSENKSPEPENKSPEPENKSPESENKSPEPESGNKTQKSENKSQKSENKSPEPESGNKTQKSENKSPEMNKNVKNANLSSNKSKSLQMKKKINIKKSQKKGGSKDGMKSKEKELFFYI
jgi:hypothetical protein